MSFAGHVLDMINRQKQNRALMVARRERFRFIREKYAEHPYHWPEGEKPEHRKLSEADRAAILKRIRCEGRMVMIKSVIITIIVCLAILFWIMWLLEAGIFN
jgi:hypothetical protein